MHSSVVQFQARPGVLEPRVGPRVGRSRPVGHSSQMLWSRHSALCARALPAPRMWGRRRPEEGLRPLGTQEGQKQEPQPKAWDPAGVSADRKPPELATGT